MTLSLVAVFIPLLFMSGMNGRLFREFSITLAVSILVSGFISLSLTPMLCSRFLPKSNAHTGLQKAVTNINSVLVQFYGKTLKWCFNHSKTVLLVAVACMAVTVPLFTRLPVNLIPPEDRGFIIAFVSLPSGTAPAETKEYQSRLGSLIKTNPYIENFLDLNLSGKLLFAIRLIPQSQRPPQNAIIGELQKTLNAIPGIQAFMQGYQLINIEMDFGSGGQYKLILKGMEFHDIERAAPILVQAMQSDPNITYVHSSSINDSPKLVVKVNEDQAQKLGFSKEQIQTVMQQAYGQGSVGSIQKGVIKEKIYLELLPEYKNNPNALGKLYLMAANGSLVPLKALAQWEEKLGSPKLVRQEQLPASTIRFSFAEGVNLTDGLQKVEEIASKVLPSNVSAILDGHAKSLSLMIRNTLLLLLGAAIVMYIVLGILYESFIHPLTILSSLPFAGLGGILTLYIFGEPVSIFSAVGFLLLIGIVKKNGIMMIDYAIEAQKAGIAPEQAIYEGCLVRFRPIMMTTVAAITGAIPIAIGFGDGAEMRRG